MTKPNEDVITQSGNGEEEKQTSKSVSLTPTPPQSHALAQYGSLDLLREQTRRVMMLDKGKKKLTVLEAGMVAQEAIATSANIANGEIQWWITEKNNQRYLTIYWGQPFWVRLGDEWADDKQTRLKYDHTLIEDAQEKIDLNFPEDAIVMKCEVRDTALVEAYVNQVKTLADAGFDAEYIKRVVGKEPVVIGYGCLTQDEIRIKYLDESASVYPHIQRVTKRATMNALKQFVTVQRKETHETGGLDGYVKKDWLPKGQDTNILDAVFREETTIKTDPDTPTPEGLEGIELEVAEARLRDAKELLKWTHDPDYLQWRQKVKNWDRDFLKKIVDSGQAENAEQAAEKLAYSPYKHKEITADEWFADQAVEWMIIYNALVADPDSDPHESALEATSRVYLEPVQSNKDEEGSK